MLRLFWDRFDESADARLLRIRQFGFIRFCAIYALVFPACRAFAAGIRAVATGTTTELASLPVAMGYWSGAGAAVAIVFWFAGSWRALLRDESNASRADEFGDASR